MPLTFTFAPGFLEAPDEEHEDAIKLAQFVMSWWRTDFLNPEHDKIQEQMVQLARQLLEKHDAKNIF